MPEVPVDATRERFGLPEDARLLLCPQSLFKVHPDNDALFARVLDAVPDRAAGAVRGTRSAPHAALSCAPRASGHRRRAAAHARCRSAARRLPAPEPRVRRDARHAALVGRQHEPRRPRLRAAAGDAARTLHARPAERRHAFAGGCERAGGQATTTTTWRSRRDFAPTTRGAARCRSASRPAAGGFSTIRRRSRRWPTSFSADAARRARAARPRSRPRARTSRRTRLAGRGGRAGYQGLSARSSSHRQSGTRARSTHSGLPSAPARCARLVSTLMTRSSAPTSAAKSVEVVAQVERDQSRRVSARRRRHRARRRASTKTTQRRRYRRGRARPRAAGCGGHSACCRPLRTRRCRRAGGSPRRAPPAPVRHANARDRRRGRGPPPGGRRAWPAGLRAAT